MIRNWMIITILQPHTPVERHIKLFVQSLSLVQECPKGKRQVFAFKKQKNIRLKSIRLS